jgi:hypothetical protein
MYRSAIRPVVGIASPAGYLRTLIGRPLEKFTDMLVKVTLQSIAFTHIFFIEVITEIK